MICGLYESFKKYMVKRRLGILKLNIDAIRKDNDVLYNILPKEAISCKIIRINGPIYLIPEGRHGVYVYHLVLEGTEHGFVDTFHRQFTHEPGNDYVFDPSEKYTLCKHDVGQEVILQVVVNK